MSLFINLKRIYDEKHISFVLERIYLCIWSHYWLKIADVTQLCPFIWDLLQMSNSEWSSDLV